MNDSSDSFGLYQFQQGDYGNIENMLLNKQCIHPYLLCDKIQKVLGTKIIEKKSIQLSTVRVKILTDRQQRI